MLINRGKKIMERFFEKAAPKNRVVLLIMMDIFAVQLASFVGLFLRFECL